MAVFVGGLVAAVVFYVIILAVGIWAGFKQKDSSQEEVMVAGRSIGVLVGSLTLIATWVGGAYINGVAECMFSTDVISCQMPIGYSLSIIIGSLLFVKPLRDGNYLTILDPFQRVYGDKAGSIILIPVFLSDVLWCAAVLGALGSSLMLILNISMTISVMVSAAFAAAYTMVGGLYSVSYTDVAQMVFIVIGLVMSVAFAFNGSYVSQSKMAAFDWVGHVETRSIWTWIDNYLLLILSGPMNQSYVQRILSIKSTRAAQVVSAISLLGTLAVAVPPALVGAAGRAADWENVPGFNRNVTSADAVDILPLVLKYLTPYWVACFGLGAVAAAAMSSADAVMLSSSSIFARNIYKASLRPKASEREVVWVLRFSVAVVAVLAASVALNVESVYSLSILSNELTYVIISPHLLIVVHYSSRVNTYGFLFSFVVGVLIRLLSGEPTLGLPAALQWPLYDAAAGEQLFPFKTVAMLCTLAAHFAVSWLARACFERGWLAAERWDLLWCFPQFREGGLVLETRPRPPGDSTPSLAGSFSYLDATAGDIKTSPQ